MPDINMQVFEEVQRNQLVTEVDIQSQTALTDYQVQLADVANPTNSPDNVVIGDGEFLSHWNETLDFDVWVKLNITTSGARVLLLQGNAGLSSGSSISGVGMTPSDHFDDSDYSSYTLAGTPTVSETGTEITVTPNTTEYLYKTQASANYIIESKLKMPTNYYQGIVFKGASDSSIYVARYRADDTVEIYEEPSVGTVASSAGTHTDNTYYKFVLKVVGTDYALTTYDMAGSQVATMSGSDSSISGTRVGVGGYEAADQSIVCDYIFTRKYTATEPTSVISAIPKNIATSLHSLGRAG